MTRRGARLRGAALLALLAAACGDRPDAVRPAPRPAPAPPTAIDSVVAAGDSAYWEGEFDLAAKIWEGGLERARAASDRRAEAVLLTSLGLAAWRLGDPEAAGDRGEAALELKLELGLDGLLFRSYNALGLLAWHEGRLERAAELFAAASGAARAVGDAESLAKATNNLGLVYTEAGDFESARSRFRETLEAARAIGNRTIEATAQSNLGMLAVRIGDPQTGVARLREARRLFREVDDAFYEQNTLGQLGNAYLDLGEPGLALAVLDTALARARATGLRQEEASNLELVAEVYRTAGDYPRALEHYRRAQALNEALGLEVERGTNLRSEADVFAALGDQWRARELALRALEVHQRVGAEYEALSDLLLLADLDAATGSFGDAEERLDRARRLSRGLAAHSARADVALVEARLAERRRAFRRVLRVVRQAEPDLALGSYAAQAEAEHLRARAFAGLGLADSAAVAGRRAIEHLERIRGGYDSPHLRTTFLAGQGAIYADQVEVLLRLGEVDEAFETADRARGRALLEHLAGAPPPGSGAGTLRSFARAEGLLRTIGSLSEGLREIESVPPEERSAADARTVEFLTRRLVEARSHYSALRMAAPPDARAATILSGRSIRAEAVRAALAPGEAMISWLVTPARIRIFVVTRSEIRSLEHETPADDLASRVRLARDLLADPAADPDPRPAVLVALHEALVGPALRSGGLHRARRLIVVPHGVLAYLPLAALVDPVSGHYLVEDYELLTLPSASTLPVLRDAALRNGRARPVEAARVLAPFPRRLPATRHEARAVARALPRAHTFEGGEATEAAVIEGLTQARVVHVATHGVMNPRNPLFSRLELARDHEHAARGDGRLEVHELLDVRAVSELVFLSGCETGVGTAWSTGFERGEDYATLSRALLYAGVRSVVATLWRIEDRGAAAFAERFYGHIVDASPAAALARAQRASIRDPRYRSPYYWAAYRVDGEE